MEEFKIVIATEFHVDPKTVYNSWLDSEGHEYMTGGEASFTNQVGANFTAWDGYISGKILKVTPNKRILQTWRTTEFDENTPDSIVEVMLKSSEKGTRMTITHTDLNSKSEVAKYKAGWEQHYIIPMTDFFNV